jgi:uncharacterized protein (DUF1501 family)
VASPYRDRSHFDGQDVLENGMITPHAANSGWLNRAIAAMGGGDRRIGLAVGQTIPLVLRGATAVASWAPTKIPAADPGFLSLVQTVYQGDPLLSAALAGGIAANQAADRAFGGDPEAMDGGAAAYKGQRILADAAGRMLADPAGPRIAALDAYGWDTHAGQGAAKGRLAGALGGLAVSLTQLRQSLGPVWKDTIVVMATEFGRTVRVNGTGGTDHGSGGAMLLAGGGVAGGKVIAKWPGLSEAALYQDRDLAPTTDLRAVLKAVLREHMRIPADRLEATIFPNSADARPIAGIAAA